MGKEKKVANMVHKQTLYIAVLVALTAGFMAGAAYTSFTLARDGVQTTAGNGQGMTQAQSPAAQTDTETGARILELETFTRENPDNAEAWTRLGNLFFDAHRFKDAIDAYGRSLALVPGDPHVLTDMGVMYRRNKEPEKAIECFDKAIAAHPDFETARFNKGIVLLHDLNNVDGAVKAWQGLVDINPMAEAPNGQLVNTLIKGLKQPQ